MSRKLYTQDEQNILMLNKYVKKVSEKSITYTNDFKIYAIDRYFNHFELPSHIFIKAGFNLDIIGHDKPKECLRRWRNVYKLKGEVALLSEARGSGATGRFSDKELTSEDKIKKLEAKLKRLERENELLKKLEPLERSVKEKTSSKYKLIKEFMDKTKRTKKKHQRNLFTVKYLCEFINVSRSGYYKWLKRIEITSKRVLKELEDYKIIKGIFENKRKKAGWRTIKMALDEKGIIMNHKRIRRIMKKYGIRTKVRKANPYKNIHKATKEHRTMPNILNRQFKQNKPFKVFGTDITYLIPSNGSKYYLSVLLDYASGEVVNYKFSKTLGLELSVGLVDEALQLLNSYKTDELLIHSDQGVHYTNPSYIKLLKSNKIIQSMSRKGNCLDNAPIESFFGHLKDELDYNDIRSYEELNELVNQHITYYNNSRKRWTKNKMTPVEYRNHLLAA